MFSYKCRGSVARTVNVGRKDNFDESSVTNPTVFDLEETCSYRLVHFCLFHWTPYG